MSDMTQTPPLRGAVVGYGFIASRGHVPAYLERARTRGDVELVAIADTCEERRALARAAVPGARVYATHQELLSAEAGRLDFVDVCTPPVDHEAIAHAALDSGLHVLCEKPLACTPEEAKSMLVHAERAKRTVFPCHNYKHAPVVKAIRDIIASGRIGEVTSLTLSTYRNTHAKGVKEWRPDWRRDRQTSGGGITMDHGSHTFYLTFDWLGAYPTAVTAKMSKRSGEADTEDNATIVLTFPNGQAHTHLTWTAGVRKVIYAVQGARGAITVDDDDMQVAEWTGPGPEGSPGTWSVERSSIASNWMDASHVSWFDSLFEQFASAIARGEHVGKEALEALRCVQIIDAAYRSSAQGCREMALPDATFSRERTLLLQSA